MCRCAQDGKHKASRCGIDAAMGELTGLPNTCARTCASANWDLPVCGCSIRNGQTGLCGKPCASERLWAVGTTWRDASEMERSPYCACATDPSAAPPYTSPLPGSEAVPTIFKAQSETTESREKPCAPVHRHLAATHPPYLQTPWGSGASARTWRDGWTGP